MGLQSGNTVKPKSTKPPSETRKIRKPLMERKRRERINTSLNDLAALLTEANLVKGETGKASKLEKADILELTVKHLKELKETRSDTCNASTSSDVGKDTTEAASQGKACNSGDETSSGNANNKHTEPLEDKQNINHTVKETPSDGKHDKTERTDCSLPLIGSEHSSNVCEIICSKEEKSNSAPGEQRSNSINAGPSTSKASVNTENYALGFKKCMSAIESVMKVKRDYENFHQANIRPKLLSHLKNFLKSIDIDLKTSVSSSQICIDTVSLDGSDSSSTVTDVSSTTSEGNSNNSPMPSLTLVPTRLPGGHFGFVVQGGAEATALLQSAEIMLQKPETKEEKSSHKRLTEGKSIIKSEDLLPSDNIKTRKMEDIRPIKVENSNYTTQIQTKESSQLQSSQQPVFKQTTISNPNLSVQPSPISTAAMTPDKPPSKVSQTITEISPENERHDNYILPLTPQTPTVRPNTAKTLSSPLITPSTSSEHSIIKRGMYSSRATTAVAPLRPVDTNISQLSKTSPLQTKM
ncbi:serine-rich adhesin for platelets-like [Palaemon carinicauda]|uniref:serine-rich adhesin for platelets-like n=1 Tax=Palaemon carinicauda TaxID=392227 RepID=UPI0035B5FC1B